VVDEGRLQASNNKSHAKALRFLTRNASLDNPESIRTFIASRKCSGGRKENLVDIYSKYAKCRGIAYDLEDD